MDTQTADFCLSIAAMVYNFGLVCLATYLVAVYDWSLWTYVGFAFFMTYVKNVPNT
jgi:hypothetical protein